MSLEFTIDIIEQNKDRLFITGLSLTALALTDTFTVLLQYGSSQKSKKQIASLELVVETIIILRAKFEFEQLFISIALTVT